MGINNEVSTQIPTPLAACCPQNTKMLIFSLSKVSDKVSRAPWTSLCAHSSFSALPAKADLSLLCSNLV